MPKRYPPLSPEEVRAILRARGFGPPKKRRGTSHEQWPGLVRGKRRLVTVDTAYREFDDYLIGSMIRQSGLTREEFYGATETTALKINIKGIVGIGK